MPFSFLKVYGCPVLLLPPCGVVCVLVSPRSPFGPVVGSRPILVDSWAYRGFPLLVFWLPFFLSTSVKCVSGAGVYSIWPNTRHFLAWDEFLPMAGMRRLADRLRLVNQGHRCGSDGRD